MKKRIILSLMLMIAICTITITSVYGVITAFDANETIVSGLAVQKKITVPYVFTSSGYERIKSFPINAPVFNSSPDFFCAQHGIPYGSYGKVTLGDSYHVTHQISAHKASGQISDMHGDVPSSSTNIYVDEGGNFVVNKDEPFNGFRNVDETPTDTVYTNWVYNTRDVQFDCEGKSSGKGTSQISDMGFAFLLACYKQPGPNNNTSRGSYVNDPLQHAEWAWLGQLGNGSNPLKAAADTYENYHRKSATPNVDVVPDSHVGTVKSGTSYVVGPFKMSNYFRAQDTNSYDVSGTASGSYLEDEDFDMNVNDTGINLQDVFNSVGDHKGTIIKAEAVVTNEGGATKKIEFPVPEPNATFSIDLSEAAIAGYDELLDIIFTYQRIHASGNGTFYIGTQYKMNWSEKSSEQSSCSYSCQDSTGSGNCSFSKSPGTSSTPYSGSCTHTWYDDCYLDCHGHEDHSGCDHANDSCSPSTTYCSGCHHEHRGAQSYTHSDPYKCHHGHEDCWEFLWQRGGKSECAQDGFAGAGVLVNEQIEYKIRVSVPMKTEMEIYKYITKVDHVGEAINIYNGGEERRPKTMDEKKNDPVKVERGDEVTYIVELVNYSRFPTRVKVKDTLPEPCTVTKMDSKIRNSAWITIEPKSTVKYEIKVRPTADSGKYTNIIEFITRNDTNPHMQCPLWDNQATHGAHTNGSIVNIRTKEKDSDTYEIKEFNVGFEKYIYDVEHDKEHIVPTSLDTTMPASDERSAKNGTTEAQKKANPVYAEYGDVVTYKIIAYNTMDSTGSRFDIQGSTRDGKPYWEPDKVYVNIEDKLPNKFSRLKIEVENTGITGNDSHTISAPEASMSGGKIKIDNLMIPAGGTRTITITLVVEEHQKGVIEENNAKLDKKIKNINRGPGKSSNVNDKYCVIKNNAPGDNLITSDFYIINDYELTLDKYISDYKHEMTDFNNSNDFTNETNTLSDRYEMTEEQKKNAPLQAEKNETIIYSIRLTNDAKTVGGSMTSAIKRATQVRPTKIQDAMDAGLEYQGVAVNVYKADGSVKFANVPVTHEDIGNNTHTFEMGNKYGSECLILDPTDYIIYEITVKVTKTNMYLYSLENTGTIRTLTDINHDEFTREVKNDEYNENIADQQVSKEYVKLKDLVIAGKVWLDRDKDGYMGQNGNGNLEVNGNAIDVETNPSTHIDDTTGKEFAMKGIVVKLYKDDGTLVRTTKTDGNGLFTFSRLEDGSTYYAGAYKADGSGVTESEQRVDKATNKDPNKNYTELSELINYYVEYEYDGLVYKSTEIYSDNKNIGVEGEIDDKYKRDSNAYEFTDVREEFNKHYEIVAFNKAYNGDLTEENALEYEKSNHESYIRVNKDRKITARSFINVPSNSSIANTKLLWLLKQTSSDYKPETEYLKYINLGLEEREDVDLDITQDVYELKTTINGEEMTYEYNQNKFTSKVGEVFADESRNTPKAIDKEHSTDEYNSEFYMTGYKDDTSGIESNRKLYSFEYYLEDYNYRISQYHIDTVRAYKGSPERDFNANAVDGGASVLLDNSVGRESELNTEITFRIKVTNNSITDDEPHKAEGKDIKVYTGINEIVEYYDTDFVDLTFNSDGSIKGFNVKEKDAHDYLVNKEIKVLSAKAVMGNGQEKPVTLTKESAYNAERTLQDGGMKLYDTLYIRPAVENTSTNVLTGQGIKASEFMLAEGESMDILITFVVEKELENPDIKEIETILGIKENVAEISSYSTYYKDGENYKSASLIDKDSNPNNFGETYESVSNVDSSEYLKFFEDDTFKTGILLKVPSPPPDTPPPPPGEDPEYKYKYNVQRTLKGYVWDDARSETATDEDGTQYIGNGKYGDGVSALEEARKNKAFEQSDGSNKEENDFSAKDVKAQLIEVIKMPDPENAGVERVYEDTIYVNGETGEDASVMKTRTAADGTYMFNGYIPGEYIVRFTYGDKEADEDINALSEERFIFNGQDYKSTTYQPNESVYAENAQANEDKTPGDVKLEILEKAGQSDAKDDEIRRLEVIGYSETVTNQKNEILKGKYSSDKIALLGQTYMNSETTDFLVRTEKEIRKVTILTYKEYNKKVTETITEARFNIANIDFGLQYRPEQQLALNKYISNITVLTSDTNNANSAEPLVDAIFDEYYGVVRNTDFVTGATTFITDAEGNTIKVDPNGSNSDIENAVATGGGNIGEAQKNNDGTYVIAVAGTELNVNKSVGLQNVQYLPNEYEKDSNGMQALEEYPRGSGKYLVKATQGFAYIVLDDNILQGATIKVKYLFTGTNISEVDRVSSNLSDLRFKENTETEKYAKLGGTQNQVYDEVTYQVSDINNKPTFINHNYSPALTARNAMFSEYYRYELEGGNIKKDLTNKDILYRVKVKDLLANNDKVVEIADIQKAPNAGNPHSGTTGYYGRYLGSTYYTGKINDAMEVIAELKIDKILDYVDNDLVFNNDENRGENNLWKTTTTKELYDANMLNKFTYTYYDSNGKPVTDNTTTEDYKLVDADGRAYDTAERSNLALSLDDRVRDDLPADQDTTVNKKFSRFLFPRYADSNESIGIISLATSKVLSPEDKTDDMTYENIAEIIQYSSVTGRVTNLATTIGNAKMEEISNESPEFHEGRTESDTASVEKVTLTPPTGLNRINRVVRDVVKGASYTVVVIIVVALACVAVTVGITLYHKRRIK
ncbi:MAG: hypothetical protein OSJ66_02960 [Clostridia bacterium]|nr:hypothetical protein [Clostridia bacterium]